MAFWTSKKIRLLIDKKKVRKINITLSEAKENKNKEYEINDIFNNNELKEKLASVLKDEDKKINISLRDGNKLIIEEVGINTKTENLKSTKKGVEKKSLIRRVAQSIYNVGETLFDSLAKKILKKKYKINYSVYNNGKDAIKAAKEKDSKKFLKKFLDAILYSIKKIPSETRNVIKNTKNTLIDEAFSYFE